MQHMRTADAVIESLIRHGIDTLYALPGVHNDHLFDAAHRAQDRFRVLHPRHEQTAAYMALGAALVTGKPQAFAVVPGPGIAECVGCAAHRLRHGRAGDRAGRTDPVIRDRPGAWASARDPRPARSAAPHHQARRPHPRTARGAGTGGRGDPHRVQRTAATGGAGMRDRHLGRDRRGRVPPTSPRRRYRRSTRRP